MKIRHLYISPGHNYFGHHGLPPGQHVMEEREIVECVAGRGLRGDRFFDYRPNYKGQVTFFAVGVAEQLESRWPQAAGKWHLLRRNVILDVPDLTGLVGKQFTLQGVQFEAVEECRPCYWMDQAIGPGAENWLQGRGGLRCRILTDGWLRVEISPSR